MARSLGFGSNTAYLSALLRLAFASAPSLQLNLACNINSPVHSAKGTPSPINGLWLFVSTWFQYSISLPSRGSFHLSITVLVRYRSINIFSLGRWSCRIQTGFLVPRPTCENTYKFNSWFRILGFHHLWRAIQTLPLSTRILIHSVNAVGFYAKCSETKHSA